MVRNQRLTERERGREKESEGDKTNVRKESLSILLVFSIFFMTTKPVISVNFSKLRFTHHLKAE